MGMFWTSTSIQDFTAVYGDGFVFRGNWVICSFVDLTHQNCPFLEPEIQ